MDYTKTALEILTRVCETDEVEEDLDLDLLEAAAGLHDGMRVGLIGRQK